MRGLFDDLQPAVVHPRTVYRLDGHDVEVMGTSPLMVWFRRVHESQQAQRAMLLAEFTARATFLCASEPAQ